MKFFDILKISCKSMLNNKLRTILVWFILFIMAAIVLLVMSVGVGLFNFINETVNNDTTPSISIGYDNYSDYSFSKVNTLEWQELVLNNFPELSCIFMRSKEVKSENGDLVMTNLNYNIFEGRDDYLLKGKMWDKSYEGQKYAWINKTYAVTNKIDVTDGVDITLYGEDNSRYTLTLTIAGIVDYQFSAYDNSGIIFCDYSLLQSYGAKVNSFKFQAVENGNGYTVSSWIKYKNFIKNYNQFDDKKNVDGVKVSSDIVNYDMVFLSMFGILAVVIIICTIVLLLSIGAISNAIEMMVEQNAQFFGMMKAIGMRDSSIYKIIHMQSILIIIASVAIASLFTFAILPLISPLFISTFASLGLIGIQIAMPMPIYLPFVIFAVLVGMVLLWSRKSLKSMSDKDVISMINEVGQ